MSRRSKAVVAVALVALVSAFIAVQLILGGEKREIHVVAIPPGAFIPPSDWKPGELVFSNRYYNPSNLTINVGDTVRWVNRDSVTHTVTHAADKKLFDKILNPNEQY